MNKIICNTDEVIDSRDVISRIKELTEELRKTFDGGIPEGIFEDWLLVRNADGDEDAHELISLRDLSKEASDIAADWEYGEVLIHESYFVDHCKELIVDIGDLPKDIPAYIAIDWEETAENLKADYAEVDFDGETYLIRST